MILSFLFLFLVLLLITALIFYLFCFFLPALKIKYEGISDSLASEFHFSDDSVHGTVVPDFSKIAAVGEFDADDFRKKLVYRGDRNCHLFHEIYCSEYMNPKICIGFGDCVKACPQEAIKIRGDRAVVSDICNGCGRCLDFCPEKIISLVPRAKKTEEMSEKGFKFWSACYKLFLVVRG